MKYSLKQRLCEYLEAHNDGSPEAEQLISKMKYELEYADADTHSISLEELEGYGNQKKLRERLGKKEGEAYTMGDCETVANAIADWICEDFHDDFVNTVDFMM